MFLQKLDNCHYHFKIVTETKMPILVQATAKREYVRTIPYQLAPITQATEYGEPIDLSST